MKKFLPTSATLSVNKRGFTLVELMIVITIIAVLSVIAITIFGNVGARARDSRRKEDIAAIANAMEANYNTVTVTATSCAKVACPGQYCGLEDCFFANAKIPIDPINVGTTCSTNACKYCVKSSGLSAGPCSGETTIGPNQPPAGTSYLICASLETNTGTGGQNFECRKNQQ